MKKILVLYVLFSVPFYLYSQSLKNERILKLKNCVGKISIDGSNSTGTGFFISEDGNVLTCWHVISPGISTDSLGHIVDIKSIYFELTDGEKLELLLPAKFFSEKLNNDAVSNDFCVLSLVKPSVKKRDFLKIGNFNDIDEGDEIYTAGYPLGISNQFISKGILSTKYIDSSQSLIKANKVIGTIKRSVALLDITLNKGNSGGPIIKIGTTVKEDEVIGIADFLLNPFGANAEQLNTELENDSMQLYLTNTKNNRLVSLTESMKLFSKAIIYSSNGISGCVSINHFLQATK